MKPWLVILFTFVLTACTSPFLKAASFSPTPTATSPLAEQTKTPPLTMPTEKSAYPDLGSAPELSGDVWLNTNTPLRLAGLRGKVVLVDMWTFG